MILGNRVCSICDHLATANLVRRTTCCSSAPFIERCAWGLERIQATLLAINSADDERNPPELGLLEREIKRVKNGRVLLIPGNEVTAGHGTTGQAKFWKAELAEVLRAAPRRAN